MAAASSRGPRAAARRTVKPARTLAFGWMLLLVLVAVALPVAALGPAAEASRSYGIEETNISAKLEPDGTLEVSESRLYSFDGSFNGVRQTIGMLGNGMRLEFLGATVSRNGADTNLEVAPMKSSWRSDPASAPKGYATFDEDRATFYAFHAFSWENAVITFNYRIVGAGQKYADTGELYWKFVAEGWDVENQDINLRLELPVPDGEQAVAGDNVLIYGHGPSDGEIFMDEAGAVEAWVPAAGDGDFAEARILFPSEWLSGVASGAANLHDSKRRQHVIEEEASYETPEQRAARRARIGEGVGLGVSILAAIGSLGLFRRYGKEYRPRFTEKYWRDVPEPGMHPAVVARLHSWDASDKDLPVTLMHLANRGAIQLIQVPDEEGRYGKHGDWAIVRTEAADSMSFEDPIDRAVMDFVFETVGKGRKRTVKGKSNASNRRVLDAMIESGAWRGYGSATGIDFDPVAAALVPAKRKHEDEAVLFSDFERRAIAAPTKYESAFERITKAVDKAAEAQKFYEDEGTLLQGGLWGLAAVLVGVGGYAGYKLELPWHYWAGLAVAMLVVGGFAWNMRRRTPPANEIAAKCRALKHWLTDFSKLDEAPPSDVKKWGELMVYAAAFDVASEALDQLRVSQPAVTSDPDFLATGYWVGSMHSTHGGSSPFDALGTSVTEAASAAYAHQVSSGGGGSFGGGGGGGFSGGGGGGFGGGGGGGAF